MKRLFLATLLAVSAFAASNPAYNQTQVDAIAHKWQRVLRLQDWEVVVFLADLDHLMPGASAYSEPVPEYKWFKLHVLSPEGYDALQDKRGLARLTNAEKLAEVEDSILHELVHLRLEDLTDHYTAADTTEARALNKAEEIVVVRLTSALLHQGALR